jgi:N-methylhydantoinase A/oxoprolinase/acetone carboxylase beta subunit
VRTSATPIPAIVVGGGSILIRRDLAGTSVTLKPEHYAVANAIGAAIGQVGGTCDRVFSLDEISRDRALETARREAVDRALAAGAARDTVVIVEIDEVPLGYLPGNATRVTVRAVGALARAG